MPCLDQIDHLALPRHPQHLPTPLQGWPLGALPPAERPLGWREAEALLGWWASLPRQ